MSDKSGQEICNCGGHGSTGGQSRPAGEILGKVLRAVVPQDYEAKFNIRLVPGRSLENGVLAQPRCKPRGHAPGWNHDTGTIAPDLVATLKNADKLMIAWLAKDTANAQSFLANPVAAMREAGVELARADEKALARANEDANSARVVGPGVQVASLSARAYPKGRIGGLGSAKPDGKADDFDCGPKKKG